MSPSGPRSVSLITPSSMSTSTARARSVRIGPVPSFTRSSSGGSCRVSTFRKKLLSASSYRPFVL